MMCSLCSSLNTKAFSISLPQLSWSMGALQEEATCIVRTTFNPKSHPVACPLFVFLYFKHHRFHYVKGLLWNTEQTLSFIQSDTFKSHLFYCLLANREDDNASFLFSRKFIQLQCKRPFFTAIGNQEQKQTQRKEHVTVNERSKSVQFTYLLSLGCVSLERNGVTLRADLFP